MRKLPSPWSIIWTDNACCRITTIALARNRIFECAQSIIFLRLLTPYTNAMNNHEIVRSLYARLVTANTAVAEARIVDAFASVRREQFVGPGPWQIAVDGGYVATETDDPTVLYQDIVVGLFPDRGINNGEPSLHAKCLGAAVPTK